MKLEAGGFATDDEEATKAYDSGRATPEPRTPRASIPSGSRWGPDDNGCCRNHSKEPDQVPTVRARTDVGVLQSVQWTHYALITAEKLGRGPRPMSTRTEIRTIRAISSPARRRVGSFGGVGLTKDGPYDISSTSAIMARVSSATWGRARRSRSRAASTPFGNRAPAIRPPIG